jgi:hypothetical protein
MKLVWLSCKDYLQAILKALIWPLSVLLIGLALGIAIFACILSTERVGQQREAVIMAIECNGYPFCYEWELKMEKYFWLEMSQLEKRLPFRRESIQQLQNVREKHTIWKQKFLDKEKERNNAFCDYLCHYNALPWKLHVSDFLTRYNSYWGYRMHNCPSYLFFDLCLYSSCSC